MALTIGFIGQGWIGKHYADDFEMRGFSVVRYGLEPEFSGNKERIADCDIVFVAVPTPTTPDGFDDSALRSALPLVGEGKIAVIKSTIIPGTTERLQGMFPKATILCSPEFLRESNAAYDASNPDRTIIGIPVDDDTHRRAAEAVCGVLPTAPFVRIVPSRAAELVKYAGNVFLALKVVYANMLFDLAGSLDIEYAIVREMLGADPRIGMSHLSPIDASGHTPVPGRGAGGHCFIKDLEAFRRLYADLVHDPLGDTVLSAYVEKNNALLKNSGKDLDLLEAVYGAI